MDKHEHTDRACIDINYDNLLHNINEIKSHLTPGCEIMAVVKSEAYGHGMIKIASYVNHMGVKAFAVATIDEGIKLRSSGISGEILILGYTDPVRAEELCKYDLSQTLIDYDYSVSLNEQGYDVKGQIKIDTGMHRLGFDYYDIDKISSVFSMKHILVTGMFSHLGVSDSLAEDDVIYTNMQIERFSSLTEIMKKRGIALPKLHIQSSYGLLNYPDLKFDYVRLGLLLYGVLGSENDTTKIKMDLKPVLSLRSKIVLLRSIKKGDTVGYSRAFIAERDSVIAILPIGYADGYSRSLSCGIGQVLINGIKAPVAGNICMDQLAVDVTDVPDVKVGMTAVLIGVCEDSAVTAENLADKTATITNELLSRLGRRLV